MDDLYRAFDDRAQVILQRIDTKQWDLLVGVIESTDRVQHMMWRLIDPTHPMYDKALAAKFGDSIERVYRSATSSSARSCRASTPTTPILIVSDHGFHSFRQSVNLNTWLVQEGFMAIQGQQPGEKKLQDLFGGGTFWENVDWTHTRAYSMGLGQIYFNLQGREGHGSVAPADSDARAERDRRPPADDDRPEDQGADRRRGLQARRHLQGTVPAERVGAAGRLRRRLPRVVADVARRLAAGDRLPEHEEVVAATTARYDYKQTSGTLISSRPLAGDQRRHHGHRADGVEVLRRADTVRYRWQAALLETETGELAENAEKRFLCDLRGLCGFFWSCRAQTLPERARTEALARRATERLQALQREADRLASDERTLLGDLRKLEIERQIKAEELKRVDADAAQGAGRARSRPRARMDALQASSRAELPELQQRLVEIYKLGQARYLRLLLSTPDLRRLGQSTRTVAALAKLDRDRIATHATDARRAEEGARRRSKRAARSSATLRAAAEKAQAAAQRAAQAQDRPHPRHRPAGAT